MGDRMVCIENTWAFKQNGPVQVLMPLLCLYVLATGLAIAFQGGELKPIVKQWRFADLETSSLMSDSSNDLDWSMDEGTDDEYQLLKSHP